MLRAVSPDGQYYFYRTVEVAWEDSKSRVVGPDGEVLPYLSPEDEFLDFSADGRWMLFASDRSGTRQVYLSRFPPSGDEDWSVSVANVEGAWFRDDLSAIYYVMNRDPREPGQSIHRVELSLEPEVALGTPELVHELGDDVRVEDYDGADRFLVISEAPSSGASRAYVHTNWEKTRAR